MSASSATSRATSASGTARASTSKARPHEHHRGLLRPAQERHPRRLPRGQPRVLAELPGRVRLPLQRPRHGAADVLAHSRPRPEGSPSCFLALSVVAFAKSRKKSPSECSGSCFSRISSGGFRGSPVEGFRILPLISGFQDSAFPTRVAERKARDSNPLCLDSIPGPKPRPPDRGPS